MELDLVLDASQMDMVSAACPNCRILLVCANSALITDMGTAVNTAVTMGAMVVSNSYGLLEYSAVTLYNSLYYNHPNALIIASSGDTGSEVNFPASSNTVIAAGGTSLFRSSSTPRQWTESAWASAGCGCSAYFPVPAQQTGISKSACTRRQIADVSGVADPATGVSVYYLSTGWTKLGGTSATAPLIGAMAALNSATYQTITNAYAYPANFNDVTTGSTGGCGNYLCNAGTGYDGPTGMGSPNYVAGSPVMKPTSKPTSNPSNKKPTSIPSRAKKPTSNPSRTKKPSTKPTPIPSRAKKPTSVPTRVRKPTSAPSKKRN